MGEWPITHAEQVVDQQMGAIRDQENSQLHSKKPMPAGRQRDGQQFARVNARRRSLRAAASAFPDTCRSSPCLLTNLSSMAMVA
jgi:hypothetical protein